MQATTAPKPATVKPAATKPADKPAEAQAPANGQPDSTKPEAEKVKPFDYSALPEPPKVDTLIVNSADYSESPLIGWINRSLDEQSADPDNELAGWLQFPRAVPSDVLGRTKRDLREVATFMKRGMKILQEPNRDKEGKADGSYTLQFRAAPEMRIRRTKEQIAADKAAEEKASQETNTAGTSQIPSEGQPGSKAPAK